MLIAAIAWAWFVRDVFSEAFDPLFLLAGRGVVGWIVAFCFGLSGLLMIVKRRLRTARMLANACFLFSLCFLIWTATLFGGRGGSVITHLQRAMLFFGIYGAPASVIGAIIQSLAGRVGRRDSTLATK